MPRKAALILALLPLLGSCGGPAPQPGYTIGERVLRPAMVAIAKGGPKAAPPANDNADAPGSQGK